MTRLHWPPFREIEGLLDRYSRAMNAPLSRTQEELMSTGDWSPRVDISENDDAFMIQAELPDVKKEDVQVSLDKGVLTLRGERAQETEASGKKFLRIERHYGKFLRTFILPDNVDNEGISANYKDGILNLTLPKRPESKQKAIEVTVE